MTKSEVFILVAVGGLKPPTSDTFLTGFTDADKDYLDNNGIKGRLNYDQSIDFLKNTGRNNYLLGFNDVLHNDIDNYSPVADGVKT